ncbi:hypothetical protein C6W88_19835 [Halomonas litopenaei]|uniref:Uncharacterized protein n=1 Tax=Halomonas litopenaei TaxID=2109328 RepID=A0ABX5ITR0_9GAMM|nr:hypothetical protein C6W88_19835 [Halomonas litopenaei]PTL89357.1 hypothetical protein C6W89_18545 [Halomonas sp. SYSU XM8]
MLFINLQMQIELRKINISQGAIALWPIYKLLTYEFNVIINFMNYSRNNVQLPSFVGYFLQTPKNVVSFRKFFCHQIHQTF